MDTTPYLLMCGVFAGRIKGVLDGWASQLRPPASRTTMGERRSTMRVCIRVSVTVCREHRYLLLDVLLDKGANGGCELVLEAFGDCDCERRAAQRERQSQYFVL